MLRPARKLALLPQVPAATLHRRRQRVVVRAPGSNAELDDPADRRRHFPTLSGLGFRDEADTLPAFGNEHEEPLPVSSVRSRVAPRVPPAARSLILPPRTRPLTLLDDVDDDLAKKYREEADRLVASGIFDDWTE
jgi:hypothetical protein